MTKKYHEAAAAKEKAPAQDRGISKNQHEHSTDAAERQQGINIIPIGATPRQSPAGWRGGMATGVGGFRLNAAHDSPACARRARRMIERKMAKAARVAKRGAA